MTYFISDIHGEYDLLLRLLDKIRFLPCDKLIVLGDMIDKGPYPVKVIKTLASLSNSICILGNHEYYFLKYYHMLMKRRQNNFDRVLKQLQAYFSPDNTPLSWEYLDWVDGLPYYVQTQEYIGVHAGVPLEKDGKIKPLKDGIVEQFVCDRIFKNPDTVVNDSRTVVYGHTPTSYYNGTGEIILYPRETGCGYSRVHLDTGVDLTGMLGCFCFETGECRYVKRNK